MTVDERVIEIQKRLDFAVTRNFTPYDWHNLLVSIVKIARQDGAEAEREKAEGQIDDAVAQIANLEAQLAKEREQHERWYKGAVELGNKVDVRDAVIRRLNKQVAEAEREAILEVVDKLNKRHGVYNAAIKNACLHIQTEIRARSEIPENAGKVAEYR